MSEKFTKDNFETILEAITLVDERFTKINEADDFVSSQEGTIEIIYDICKNHIPALKSAVARILKDIG